MLVGGGRLVVTLVALISIRVVTTFLTPQQYGELALLLTVQMFCGLFFINPVDVSGDLVLSLYNLGKNFAAACAVSLLAVFWATFMLFIESKTSINQ
jgi:hypothetical protein